MQQAITVRTSGLMKTFSGTEALKRCDITVYRGEIYGILGPNGAGKTTLLKLLAGLLEPTEGSAEVMGIQFSQDREAYLRQIGSVIETPCFYDHLPAGENLSLHLAYMGKSGKVEEALERVGLSGAGGKPVGKFSLGMRQRLGIARAMIHHPPVLLLDEPINGLDPIAIKEMRQIFLSLAEEGTTLLISSHILSEVERTASRVAILSNGQLVEEIEMEALRRQHPNDLEDCLIQKMNGGKVC